MALPPHIAQQIGQAIINSRLVDVLTPDQDEGSWKVWNKGGSRAIAQFKHRSRDGMMTVRFANRQGSPDYLFIGVPIELYQQWRKVKSKGKFYHRRIKNNFNITF